MGKPQDPVDLRGGVRAPRRFVGWQTFFDFRDGQVKPRKRIDTTISTPLFNLPLGTIADGSTPTSLPQRNLLRQVTWQLPSGQRIAQEMGAPVLAARDLSELSGYGIGLDRNTPLWYYVLKEADVIGGANIWGRWVAASLARSSLVCCKMIVTPMCRHRRIGGRRCRRAAAQDFSRWWIS